MKKLLCLLALLPALAFAQGVHFEKELSWQQVLAKAKAEHKYIFVDCYTTWCGPCKYMTAQIFPQETMGRFFNSNFINVKVQLDKTPDDNEHVKSWYEDAAMIEKEYKIRSYPTFLYFSPDGKIVHRTLGSTETAAEFIARSEKALNPATQYYTQLDKYNKGNNKPEDLHAMAIAAMDADDGPNATKISREYLATQKNLLTADNIRFMNDFTHSSKDTGFTIFMKQSKAVDAVLGEGKATARVKDIITNEEVYAKLRGNAVDWASIEKQVQEKYPQYATEVVTMGKVRYSMVKKDWPMFQTNVMAYMKQFGSNASPAMLNEFAWAVFENCQDMTCVTEALEWSKRSIKDQEEPMYMDTYANILYKLGKKNEAIAMEEKAVKLSNGDKELSATLEKMKNGEPTWK